jgi:hypothetical protein
MSKKINKKNSTLADYRAKLKIVKKHLDISYTSLSVENFEQLIIYVKDDLKTLAKYEKENESLQVSREIDQLKKCFMTFFKY